MKVMGPFRLNGLRSLVAAESLPSLAAHPRMSREHGTVAVLFAVMLVVMLGMLGLALDLSRLHNRKMELQSVADAAALAAARHLNGTPDGITAAGNAARDTVQLFKYKYNSEAMEWSAAAIKFSSSPARAGTWVDGSSPSKLFYVKIDTAELADVYGDVNMVFLPLISSAFTFPSSATSVAGRTTVAVAPLAICAMSAIAGGTRANSGGTGNAELVEYGFRRGVSYDLMQLSPDATTGAANYLVNPLAPPGTAGTTADIATDVVKPYVCAGVMNLPGVGPEPIRVTHPFPLDELYPELNSRFDQYTGGSSCDHHGAPPDANIKQYVPAVSTWLGTALPATRQTALSAVDNGKLATIADRPPPGGTAAEYGPLWLYAKAVPITAYSDGVAEPSAGYSTMSTGKWSALYGGQTASTAYPAITPYRDTKATVSTAPDPVRRPGVRHRRVLHVPLLSCPVTAGTNVAASVKAIGKFFMTVEATSTTLSAEFAGAVPVNKLQGRVELFP